MEPVGAGVGGSVVRLCEFVSLRIRGVMRRGYRTGIEDC